MSHVLDNSKTSSLQDGHMLALFACVRQEQACRTAMPVAFDMVS
jgi:hypothetical protein